MTLSLTIWLTNPGYFYFWITKNDPRDLWTLRVLTWPKNSKWPPPPHMMSGFWLYAQSSHKRVSPRAGYKPQNMQYAYHCICLFNTHYARRAKPPFSWGHQYWMLNVIEGFLLSWNQLKLQCIWTIEHSIGDVVIVKWELFKTFNTNSAVFLHCSKSRWTPLPPL